MQSTVVVLLQRQQKETFQYTALSTNILVEAQRAEPRYMALHRRS